MFMLRVGPNWFWQAGISIDVFSFITLLLLALFTYGYYRVDKSKRQRLFLSLSFILMAASFVAKLGTYLSLHIYRNVGPETINTVAQTVGSPVGGVDLLRFVYIMGIPFFLFLHLLGLFLLLTITQKVKSPRSNIFLLVMSFFLVAYTGGVAPYMFNFYAFVLAAFIFSRYWTIHKSNKKWHSGILAGSFAVVALSQALFMFAANPMLYVIAQITQLLGYIGLLITFIAVFRHVKKK